MKKELFAVTALAAGMLLADTTVTTSNTLGFLPVSDTKAKAAAGMWLVTVPFIDYQGTAGASEQPVKVADVLQTANLTTGDELFIPAGDGKYDNYKLMSDKKWNAATVVTLNASGEATVAKGTPAAEATVARGTAFWVKTAATQINLLGEGVTAAKGVTVAGGGSSALKWNLIGATTCKAAIDLASFDGQAGDTIRLANGAKYQYNATAKGWYAPTDRKNKVTIVIPAGVGFWYATKNGMTFGDL